ncbi:MAG: recombinase family protein [Bacilli bacterium]|nr:recombinase family protein [Bacilli bacterium]MDD4643524.1 recombinase family protein [Bacilli bacterium]
MDIVKAREQMRQGTTIYDMKLKVSYYARVSTDKDDQLNSLENQKNYFEDLIKENKNWTLVRAYIDEGISGTAVNKREDFLNMIEDASLDKMDLILTKEISRFARNTVDSIQYTQLLLRKGVIVNFISDNITTIAEDSEFRLTLMAGLAQDEVRKLSERVKFGIKRSIKDGKIIGGGLTGYYKKDGQFIVNENERPIVEYLFETYATGKYGLKKIGEELAKMGYFTKKGKIFSQTTLKGMLENPRYKGYYTANKSRVDDYKTGKKTHHEKSEWIMYKDERIPAIVSEELWDKANTLHDSRKYHKAKCVLNRQDYLDNSKYTSKIVCGECGATFIRNGSGKRANNPVWACRTYKVDGVNRCASPNIYESQLDKIMISLITNFIDNKGSYLEKLKQEYIRYIEEYNKQDDMDIVNQKMNELEQEKEKLYGLHFANILTQEDFKKKYKATNNKIESLKKELAELETKTENAEYYSKMIDDFKKNLSIQMNIKENLVILIRLLVKKIEVYKINHSRKKLKLIVMFDFDNIRREVNLDLDNREIKAPAVTNKSTKSTISFVKECATLTVKQPRLCGNGQTFR